MFKRERLLEIIFLGTGTSHGVPPLDCVINDYALCPKDVCRKSLNDPRHRRTRTSILVKKNGKTLLADVSSDFREQALRHGIKEIDAVIISHGHIDHFGGLPDIRSYTWRKPLTVYASSETLANVRCVFSYMFDSGVECGGGIPHLRMKELKDTSEIAGFTVKPIPVTHGKLKGCLGFRIDDTAYVPDVKHIDPENEKLLEGLDCLVLNCLRENPGHSTHLFLSESVSLARRLAPKRCYFIHMNHEIDYIADGKELDSWMEFSYDGLIIKV
ncbi:MAG: MBL fold metallo-hydrolase [Chitinispirillales bacterium]|nr:MBL fold metallo-hydrolase [Chitinispirillales bacterium]